MTLFIGPRQGGLEPVKSKVSVLARLGDLHRDRQRLVDHAVGIDEGLALVDAVGDGRDLGAHLPRGAAADLGDRGVDGGVAVAVDQRGQALLAGRAAPRPGP